jgi:hypothetical protein
MTTFVDEAQLLRRGRGSDQKAASGTEWPFFFADCVACALPLSARVLRGLWRANRLLDVERLLIGPHWVVRCKCY